MATKIKLNKEHINKLSLINWMRKERYTLFGLTVLIWPLCLVNYYPNWLGSFICRLLGVMKLYLWKIMREFGIAKPISEFSKQHFRLVF